MAIIAFGLTAGMALPSAGQAEPLAPAIASSLSTATPGSALPLVTTKVRPVEAHYWRHHHRYDHRYHGRCRA